jgi:hypothetical protein
VKKKRLKLICCQIEMLRSKMHELTLKYGITHPIVLKASMSLDIKIIQYMNLVKES